VGRFIAGIAVGLTSSVVPVYQSEIAPKNVRGRLVSLQQWAITWGILIRTSPLGIWLTTRILHSIWLQSHQRNCFLPFALGDSNDPSHHPLYRSFLLPQITSLACQSGQMGRSSSSFGRSPRKRRYDPPARVGRVYGN